MAVYYSGLFEDEVSDVIRASAPCVIRSGCYSWQPAHALYEDGILSSGAGYFAEYINGRRSGIVSAGYIINLLSHHDFTISEVEQ